MTNHYFFGGRLHSPKPPRLSVFRLDVLGSSSDKSTVRACASIKSEFSVSRYLPYLSMANISTIASSDSDDCIGTESNPRSGCGTSLRGFIEPMTSFQNFSYLPMKGFSTNGLASQGADSHIASRVVTFYPYNFPLNFSLTTVKKFIGFVGTSRPASVGAFAVAVNKVLSKYSNLDTVVVSGGEPKGVDTIAVTCARKAGFEVLEYTPAVKSWEGANGYKARNIQIANKCEFVYSFVNRSGSPSCYHCHASHHKSAGCYTARLCKGGHEVVLV